MSEDGLQEGGGEERKVGGEDHGAVSGIGEGAEPTLKRGEHPVGVMGIVDDVKRWGVFSSVVIGIIDASVGDGVVIVAAEEIDGVKREIRKYPEGMREDMGGVRPREQEFIHLAHAF